MTLDKAIKMVAAEYAIARKLKLAADPLAFALHKVWKLADSKPVK